METPKKNTRNLNAPRRRRKPRPPQMRRQSKPRSRAAGWAGTWRTEMQRIKPRRVPPTAPAHARVPQARRTIRTRVITTTTHTHHRCSSTAALSPARNRVHANSRLHLLSIRHHHHHLLPSPCPLCRTRHISQCRPILLPALCRAQTLVRVNRPGPHSLRPSP